MPRSYSWLLLLGALASGACSSAGSDSPGGDAGTAGDDDAGATPEASAPDAEAPDAPAGDAGGGDAGLPSGDASPDGPAADAGNACEWGGAPGECLSTADCAALPGHTSFAGQCPGPATIQCCLVTPDPANNPPTPAGYVLMQQSDVTPDMTTWAVDILNDPATYPMFSTTTKAFGALTVLARVEWHPPDFQNAVVHRGVTLYEPAG
ncbi:MAG TPA: hypothetical protein VGI39_35285 [Polyangiaceae bacterium]